MSRLLLQFIVHWDVYIKNFPQGVPTYYFTGTTCHPKMLRNRNKSLDIVNFYLLTQGCRTTKSRLGLAHHCSLNVYIHVYLDFWNFLDILDFLDILNLKDILYFLDILDILDSLDFLDILDNLVFVNVLDFLNILGFLGFLFSTIS